MDLIYVPNYGIFSQKSALRPKAKFKMGLNEENLGYAKIPKCLTLGWIYTTLEVFLPSTIILGYALHVANFNWNIW